MAPISDAYFPSLDECLQGAFKLCSWEDCIAALSSSEHASIEDDIRVFLSNDTSVRILSNALDPPPAASDRDHTLFDQKLAECPNVQRSDISYDITEIREDALWLSKEAAIERIAALRIVILVWQARSAIRLCESGVTEASVLRYAIEHCRNSDTSGTDTGQSERRKELLLAFLRESRYVLRCGQYMFGYPSQIQEQRISNKDSGTSLEKPGWLQDIGIEVQTSWLRESSKGLATKGPSSGLLGAPIEAIRRRVTRLVNPEDAWTSLDEFREIIEFEWRTTLDIEILHILQSSQLILMRTRTVLEGDQVMLWFSLISELHQLQEKSNSSFCEPSRGLALQSIIALISLTILNVPLALDLLSDQSVTSLTSATSFKTVPYFLDNRYVNELNDYMLGHAEEIGASLAIFAWSIIAQRVREVANANRDSRELKQSISAAHKYDNIETNPAHERNDSREDSDHNLIRHQPNNSDASHLPTLLEDIHDSLMITAIDGDPMTFMAHSAVNDGKLFSVMSTIAEEFCPIYGVDHDGRMDRDMRRVLLNLLRVSLDFFEYQTILVSSVLSIIGESDQKAMKNTFSSKGVGLANLLREDDLLHRKILLVALSRFPYETMPLLQLWSAMAADTTYGSIHNPISQSLQALDIFASMIPMEYQGYKTIREDEEGDYIELVQDFHFHAFSLTKACETQEDQSSEKYQGVSAPQKTDATLILPRGTQGQILSNGKPLVVAWNFEYSGITLIGKFLQTMYLNRAQSDASERSRIKETVSEILKLISTMLVSAVADFEIHQDKTRLTEICQDILGQASDGLNRNQDIISVIQAILEEELFDVHDCSFDGYNSDILVNCMEFLISLVRISPDRVWPYFARSRLLGKGEMAGQLTVILSSYEMVIGQYAFLIACLRLYDALIADIIENSVARHMPGKVVARFATPDGAVSGSGISAPTMQKVLSRFHRIVIDIHMAADNWRFENEHDRTRLRTSICTIFDRLIRCVFFVGQPLTTSASPASQLFYVASTTLRAFLNVPSSADHDPTFEQGSQSFADGDIQRVRMLIPLITNCREGLEIDRSSLPSQSTDRRITQCLASLQLLQTLLIYQSSSGKQCTHFHVQLFSASQLLVQLYASYSAYRVPVLKVLDELISIAATSDQAPPSFTSYLEPQTIPTFLNVLSATIRSQSKNELSFAIWKFFSTSISKRQQTLAHIIILGQSPKYLAHDKSSIKEPEKSQHTFSTFLQALHILSSIESIEDQHLLSVLTFVVYAIDFWPSAVSLLEQHGDVLKNIAEWVSRLGPKVQEAENLPETKSCLFRIAACVTEMLAIYVRRTREEGNAKFAKMIIPHLRHVCTLATARTGYNRSLHANLRQNFERKFPGCALADLKCTTGAPGEDADMSCYDIAFAEEILGFDPAWVSRQGHGFREEFQRANTNIALVQAQITLFRAWKTLLVELATVLASEAEFHSLLTTTVTGCLTTIASDESAEHISSALVMSRADLAFVALAALVESHADIDGRHGILMAIWGIVRFQCADLSLALSSEKSEYSRILLQILYLALRLQSAAINKPAEPSKTNGRSATRSLIKSNRESITTTTLALEVISSLVAPGFRSLTRLLHEDPRYLRPTDISMLNCLLRSSLDVSDVKRSTAQLLSAFDDIHASRYAATLLSWSDQISNDPVYGQAALAFLLEMSNVPSLAESLAVDGVLAYLLRTSVMSQMQARPFGVHSPPHRMHQIWVGSFLPLLLNLLRSIGPSIGGEVAAALNTFQPQLHRASMSFAPSTNNSARHELPSRHMTLSLIQEAHALALIQAVLQTFRDAGASAAIDASEIQDVSWDGNQVREDIESLLQRPALLREQLVPTNDREMAWARIPSSDPDETCLERKMFAELKSVLSLLQDTRIP